MVNICCTLDLILYTPLKQNPFLNLLHSCFSYIIYVVLSIHLKKNLRVHAYPKTYLTHYYAYTQILLRFFLSFYFSPSKLSALVCHPCWYKSAENVKCLYWLLPRMWEIAEDGLKREKSYSNPGQQVNSSWFTTSICPTHTQARTQTCVWR